MTRSGVRASVLASVQYRVHLGTGLDTPQSSKTVAQTVIDAAQDPAKVLMFNYASEALNNSYFLSCLVSFVRIL